MGGILHGKVGFKLSRESGVFVKGIWVKLQLTSTTKHKNPVIERINTVDHLKNEEDHVSGGLYHVLLGVCGDVNDDEIYDVREQAFRERQRAVAAACEYVELKSRENRGHYLWDFNFRLPTDAPVSYIDEYAETLCCITAVLDSPAIPNAISQITHYVNICSKVHAETAAVMPTTTDEISNHDTRNDVPVKRKGGSNFISSTIRWLGVCGASSLGNNKHNLRLDTSRPDGFCFYAPSNMHSKVEDPISLPVLCFFQLKNRGNLQRRYQLKTKLVKECMYCIGRRRNKKRYRYELWGNIMELDQDAAEVEFSVPIQFDLSQLRAHLNAWPRPMISEESPYMNGSADNSPSSTSSRGSSTSSSPETLVGTCNRCITSCSMDTEIYSIKYYLVAELHDVTKSKYLSMISQEVKILPARIKVVNRNTASNDLRNAPLQTPRRNVLSDVTNSRTGGNHNSNRPPIHPSHSTSSGTRNEVKIVTPMAKLAVPRVQGEAISRGSAAIIMDRSREVSAGLANSTPEQFAVIRRVANENDVVIINEAAEFSPAYARLCTPSASASLNYVEARSTTNAMATPRIIFANNDGDENEEGENSLSNSIMNDSRLIEAS